MKIVLAYRGIPQARKYAFGACLARAFRRLGHEVFEYGNYYQTSEPVGEGILPSRADALIYCECNDLDPQYLELRTLAAPIKVYWDFDVDTHPGQTFRFIQRMKFTHIFFANKSYEALFRCLCPNSYYLPIGFDDELFRPLDTIAKSVDVGLCGTPYPGRVALIETLTAAGLSAQLITGVYGDAYVQTVNRFKIHLNYEVGGGRGLMPARVWETLGCRTLLMTEKADFVELFFQDDCDVVLYSTPEECIEKIKMLLQQPEQIQAIAARGYECGVSCHSYVQRAMTMLSVLDAPASISQKSSISAWLRVQTLIFRHLLRVVFYTIKAYRSNRI